MSCLAQDIVGLNAMFLWCMFHETFPIAPKAPWNLAHIYSLYCGVSLACEVKSFVMDEIRWVQLLGLLNTPKCPNPKRYLSISLHRWCLICWVPPSYTLCFDQPLLAYSNLSPENHKGCLDCTNGQLCSKLPPLILVPMIVHFSSRKILLMLEIWQKNRECCKYSTGHLWREEIHECFRSSTFHHVFWWMELWQLQIQPSNCSAIVAGWSANISGIYCFIPYISLSMVMSQSLDFTLHQVHPPQLGPLMVVCPALLWPFKVVDPQQWDITIPPLGTRLDDGSWSQRNNWSTFLQSHRHSAGHRHAAAYGERERKGVSMANLATPSCSCPQCCIAASCMLQPKQSIDSIPRAARGKTAFSLRVSPLCDSVHLSPLFTWGTQETVTELHHWPAPRPAAVDKVIALGVLERESLPFGLAINRVKAAINTGIKCK